jgi:predicted ATP-grasp superfamily ATP-dependent carboligase
MKLKILPELSQSLNKCPLVIGVGVVDSTAWSRLAPIFFLKRYKIITLADRSENQAIESLGAEVFSVKKVNPKIRIEPFSISRFLESIPAMEFMSRQEQPLALLIRRPSKRLEKIAAKRGWRLIASRKELIDFLENKKTFKEILTKLNIKVIPYESILLKQFTTEKFIQLQKKFAQKKLVAQLTEVTWGGGGGTAFLESPGDLPLFQKRAYRLQKELEQVKTKKKIETVNVSPYIKGVAASISACVTKHGIMSGLVQTQIIETEEVGGKREGRAGNSCGHDWVFGKYKEEVQQQALKIATRFGEHIYRLGYRGIFGLDLIVEEKTNKVWPIECNARYTDAFPLLSFLQMEKGLLPMDAFHILENLEIDYNIDFAYWSSAYRQDFLASQIILFNPLPVRAVNRGTLKSGIYQLKENELEYLRPAILPSELVNNREYLFTEGVPDKPGEHYGLMDRVCRLIRKDGILLSKNQLRPEVREVLKLAYQNLKIEENGRTSY